MDSWRLYPVTELVQAQARDHLLELGSLLKNPQFTLFLHWKIAHNGSFSKQIEASANTYISTLRESNTFLSKVQHGILYVIRSTRDFMVLAESEHADTLLVRLNAEFIGWNSLRELALRVDPTGTIANEYVQAWGTPYSTYTSYLDNSGLPFICVLYAVGVCKIVYRNPNNHRIVEIELQEPSTVHQILERISTNNEHLERERVLQQQARRLNEIQDRFAPVPVVPVNQLRLPDQPPGSFVLPNRPGMKEQWTRNQDGSFRDASYSMMPLPTVFRSGPSSAKGIKRKKHTKKSTRTHRSCNKTSSKNKPRHTCKK